MSLAQCFLVLGVSRMLITTCYDFVLLIINVVGHFYLAVCKKRNFGEMIGQMWLMERCLNEPCFGNVWKFWFLPRNRETYTCMRKLWFYVLKECLCGNWLWVSPCLWLLYIVPSWMARRYIEAFDFYLGSVCWKWLKHSALSECACCKQKLWAYLSILLFWLVWWISLLGFVWNFGKFLFLVEPKPGIYGRRCCWRVCWGFHQTKTDKDDSFF